MDKEYDIIIAKLVKRNILTASDNIRVNIRAKNSDVSSTISQLMKKLKMLNKDGEEIDKQLNNLKEIVGSFISITAASKADILKELENNINAFHVISDKLEEAEKIAKRIEILGKDENSSFYQLAISTIEKYKERLQTAKSILNKLAEEQRPAALSTENNKKLSELVEWIEDRVKEYNDNAKLFNKKNKDKKKKKPIIEFDRDRSEYIAEPSNTENNVIRFVRYIPILNVPTVDKPINLYAVFEVDLISPIQKKGKITSQRVSPISFTMCEDIKSPNKLPTLGDSSSLREFVKVLEDKSDRFHLAIFGHKFPFEKNVEKHRDVLTKTNKLKILNDKDIKISAQSPLLKLIFPKKYAKEFKNTDEVSNDFLRTLWWDVARFTGQEIKIKNGKGIDGYLTRSDIGVQKEKIKKLSDGRTVVIYRSLENKKPINPRKEIRPPQPPRDITDKIKEVTEYDLDQYKDIAQHILDVMNKKPKIDDFDNDIDEEKSSEQIRRERKKKRDDFDF